MEIISYKTDSVISKAGTKIEFRQVGQETSVILVHGSVMASQDLMKLASYKTLHAQVLLLGGSKSDTDIKTALNRLSLVLPTVSRIELSGLGHSALANNGKSEL